MGSGLVSIWSCLLRAVAPLSRFVDPDQVKLKWTRREWFPGRPERRAKREQYERQHEGNRDHRWNRHDRRSNDCCRTSERVEGHPQALRSCRWCSRNPGDARLVEPRGNLHDRSGVLASRSRVRAKPFERQALPRPESVLHVRSGRCMNI